LELVLQVLHRWFELDVVASDFSTALVILNQSDFQLFQLLVLRGSDSLQYFEFFFLVFCVVLWLGELLFIGLQLAIELVDLVLLVQHRLAQLVDFVCAR
jgi:hypothetical protein